MKISRISLCISGLVKVAILTCARSVNSLADITVIIVRTWSQQWTLSILRHHQLLSMPPSCSAVSCVSLTESRRQLGRVSQSSAWSRRSLTRHWSGQSASVTAVTCVITDSTRPCLCHADRKPLPARQSQQPTPTCNASLRRFIGHFVRSVSTI